MCFSSGPFRDHVEVLTSKCFQCQFCLGADAACMTFSRVEFHSVRNIWYPFSYGGDQIVAKYPY